MKRINSKIKAVMGGIALLVSIVACTNNNESTKSSAYDSSNVATNNDTSMNHMQQTPDTAANVSSEKPVSKEATEKSTANKTTAKKKGKATVVTMGETNRPANTKTTFKPDASGIYDATEVRPMYPGGQSALSDYIANHIDYPQMAIDDNKQGTVNVQFVVDENGKVQNAKVVGGKLGDGLDEEAERVISTMPKWNAGTVKGKAVKTRITVPITYQIEE